MNRQLQRYSISHVGAQHTAPFRKKQRSGPRVFRLALVDGRWFAPFFTGSLVADL
jgi:hypothetical protein